MPRIVIAATGSGTGKTTVTIGLIRALRARGFKVAPFKCGPDYLDPTYHARAAGQASHNLDTWMMGRAGVIETFVRGSHGADIAVIEGMMGLFDSADPTADEGSTAELAKWLDAPVLIVTDASGVARTINAISLGFARFDPHVRTAGLICNKIGGRGHLELLRAAKPELPIIGGLPPEGAPFPERHLGLLSANEKYIPEPLFARWGELVAQWMDLDHVIGIAQSAPELTFDSKCRLEPQVRPCRIGIAYDEAFHFYYEYNLAELERSGADLVRFSPSRDQRFPDVDGLYFGGGYPETAASELSSNTAMREAVQSFAAAGRPIYAECGGLMYLSEGIKTIDGKIYPMVGAIPGVAVMRETLQAIGYVEIESVASSFLGNPRMRWRGHQFRYSHLEPAPSGDIQCSYQVRPRWGGETFSEGYCRRNVLASYVHAHWASNPAIAANFVEACARTRT
jgi:cobyrinic acid a,c-diamide synthase